MTAGTTRLTLTLLAALLAGCNAPGIERAIDRISGAPGKHETADPAPPGAAQLIVRIPEHNKASMLHEIDPGGPVRRWVAADNVQIYTRDGLITGTRGLAYDLMTTDSDVAAVIRSAQPGQVPRIQRMLDGEDRLEIHAYICDITPAGQDQVQIGETEWVAALRVEELCQGPRGEIRNRHWVRNGQILRSIQTWTDDLGPLDILFMP